jgi:hypothetical protein
VPESAGGAVAGGETWPASTATVATLGQVESVSLKEMVRETDPCVRNSNILTFIAQREITPDGDISVT